MGFCFKWLLDNTLSLHIGKTECILFGPRRKLKNVQDLTCNNHVIKSSSQVKYVRVIIENNLSGEYIVDSIKTKSIIGQDFYTDKQNF